MNNEKIKKIRKMPSITYVLIFINIVLYLVEACTSFFYLKGGILKIDNVVLVLLGGMVNVLVEQGQYYRLITAGFLHSSILHLTLNMVALNAIGDIVEKILGKGKFLILYLISLIASSYGSYIFTKGNSGIVISVGASGAIFGILGALLVIVIMNRNIFGKNLLRGLLEIVFVNILIGVFVPNIDVTAHFVGAITGAIVAYIIMLNEKKKLRKQ
ncbi:rhomboid family intramembrane serine protease [Clostridium ihumii]|uniref:rhomboid family intramembrane serine protease n=1 Tax=Clostridium ihumii TaxID=1470356 RepID=UPI00058DAFFE|nr:rhomboid family intramembrane serine protease [Clostridium ihumii]